MNNAISNRIVEEIAGAIDIPDSSYEKTEQRYKDLGEWFGRNDSRCYSFDPHIYPQGSFRFGTVVRPINAEDDYDLDLGCRLRSGLTKMTHTQEQLKHLIGAELEEYRKARGIKEKREEMHRCWRLKYADTLRFHMDVVPSIPESPARRQLIMEAMTKSGTPRSLAIQVAEHAGAITDNQLPNYGIISSDWKISNSEGYARWFESRMKLAGMLLEKSAFEAKAAKVDDLPAYRWKSPLQKCVQILKRHRDVMFERNPDSAPISIIITTLAGLAYQGEEQIGDALNRILSTMKTLINPGRPRVPNPVNPVEDFADKWDDAKYRHLNLEKNFYAWIQRATNDFLEIGNARQANVILEHAQKKFRVGMSDEAIKRLGLGQTSALLRGAAVPGGLSFPPKPVIPNKPAGFA